MKTLATIRIEGAYACVVCGVKDDCVGCDQKGCVANGLVYCETHLANHDGHALFGGEEVCSDCERSFNSETARICFNCGKTFCCQYLGYDVDGYSRSVCMFCLRAILLRDWR